MAARNTTNVLRDDTESRGTEVSRIRDEIYAILREAEKNGIPISSVQIERSVSFALGEVVDISGYLKPPDFILTNVGWRIKLEGRKIHFRGKERLVKWDNVHNTHRAVATCDYLLVADDGEELRLSRFAFKGGMYRG